MIERTALNDLLLAAFTREITWLEASERYSVDDYIETFHATRALMTRTLADLTDDEVWFASPVHPFWSISETITHLIYTQNAYINRLLEVSTTDIPHIVEAARGFGEGAVARIPAADLRQRLAFATEQITTVLAATRHTHDPEKREQNALFGVCDYRTWTLLLLGHETDHTRQVITMRRLARREGGTPG